MESPGRYVAQVWHEVLMNSATAEDVAKYAPLAGRSPVELRILLLAGSTQDLPLSAYAEALHLPKSTLTSILQRLERQGYLHRTPRETDALRLLDPHGARRRILPHLPRLPAGLGRTHPARSEPGGAATASGPAAKNSVLYGQEAVTWILPLTKPPSPETLSSSPALVEGLAGKPPLAFAALGAFVLLTDIDRARGEQATAAVNLRFPQAAHFLHADLSDKEAVAALCEKVLAQYGCPDILFHNAAVVVTGQVGAVPFQAWEHSYAVNLRAPILLTSSFLPHMRKRDRGCVVFVSSSGAAPYLNAYEVFKTAQGEFSNGLAAELEGTHIYTYTIAPGLVRTQTAEDSIQAVAAHMGLSTEAFYREQAAHTLSPRRQDREFALSTLERFHLPRAGDLLSPSPSRVLGDRKGPHHTSRNRGACPSPCPVDTQFLTRSRPSTTAGCSATSLNGNGCCETLRNEWGFRQRPWITPCKPLGTP